MENKLEFSITEKSLIKKFAEGADPLTDQPFEITDGPAVIYKGLEAVNRLRQMGLSDEAILKLKESAEHATN